MPTVILFKTTNATTVHVHDETCRLVAAARRSRGLIRVIAHDEESVADLTERGWAIKRCKCAT